MIKDNPNYVKFVESWASKQDWRDPIIKPVCYPTGWVCSTNSYKLLWLFDEDYVKNDNVHDRSKSDDGVDATKVISEYSKFYEGDSKPIGKIKLSNIEKIYEDIKMIPEFDKKYKDCYHCDGHGTIECDCCGHETECDECDGEGQVECGEQENGVFKYPTNHFITISGVHLSLHEMREVIDNLKFVGVEELNVYPNEGNFIKSFFGIPNEKMYILIMGNMIRDVEKTYDVQINTL